LAAGLRFAWRPILALLAGLLLLPVAPAAAVRDVRTGAERILDGSWPQPQGLKVGLVTHGAAVTRTGERDVEALVARGPWQVVRLFTPEHGLDAALQGRIQDGRVEMHTPEGTRSLPVRSLYGARLKPVAEDLEGLDALVFDLQDVGARFYTYGSTLKKIMEAAAEHGRRTIVLDRPNPLGGEVLEGGVLDPAFHSFTGPAAVAVRHGLTMGELAQWFHGTVGGNLEVVPVAGLHRRDMWQDLDRTWTAPSPAMTSLESAWLYPGACFFEATSVDVRVGERPFTTWAAPWLDARGLAAHLAALGLPGVAVSSRVMPMGTIRTRDLWERHEGPRTLGRTSGSDPFPAVVLEVTDPRAFRPVTLAVHALVWIRKHHGASMALEPKGFDRMAGTDRLRLGLLEGRDAKTLLTDWTSGLNGHAPLWRKVHLYR